MLPWIDFLCSTLPLLNAFIGLIVLILIRTRGSALRGFCIVVGVSGLLCAGCLPGAWSHTPDGRYDMMAGYMVIERVLVCGSCLSPIHYLFAFIMYVELVGVIRIAASAALNDSQDDGHLP